MFGPSWVYGIVMCLALLVHCHTTWVHLAKKRSVQPTSDEKLPSSSDNTDLERDESSEELQDLSQVLARSRASQADLHNMT